MGENDLQKELMPKYNFDQFLENIESEAKIFFRLPENHRHKNELREDILGRMSALEENVINALSVAFSPETVQSFIIDLNHHTTDMSWGIYHGGSYEDFLSSYVGFKEEAIRLILEATDAILSLTASEKKSLEPFASVESKRKGGKAPKFKKGIQDAIDQYFEEETDKSLDKVWRYLKKNFPAWSPGDFNGSVVYVDEDSEQIFEGGKPINKNSLRRYINQARLKKVSQ